MLVSRGLLGPMSAQKELSRCCTSVLATDSQFPRTGIGGSSVSEKIPKRQLRSGIRLSHKRPFLVQAACIKNLRFWYSWWLENPHCAKNIALRKPGE